MSSPYNISTNLNNRQSTYVHSSSSMLRYENSWASPSAIPGIGYTALHLSIHFFNSLCYSVPVFSSVWICQCICCCLPLPLCLSVHESPVISLSTGTYHNHSRLSRNTAIFLVHRLFYSNCKGIHVQLLFSSVMHLLYTIHNRSVPSNVIVRSYLKSKATARKYSRRSINWLCMLARRL